jgi:zinc transport system permease protein
MVIVCTLGMFRSLAAHGLFWRRYGTCCDPWCCSVALAITVAVAIKVVGALLIATMLIIPAAAAQPLSWTPEGKAITAGLIGILLATVGLRATYVFDTPLGPSIVYVAAIIFIVSGVFRKFSPPL